MPAWRMIFGKASAAIPQRSLRKLGVAAPSNPGAEMSGEFGRNLTLGWRYRWYEVSASKRSSSWTITTSAFRYARRSRRRTIRDTAAPGGQGPISSERYAYGARDTIRLSHAAMTPFVSTPTLSPRPDDLPFGPEGRKTADRAAYRISSVSETIEPDRTRPRMPARRRPPGTSARRRR